MRLKRKRDVCVRRCAGLTRESVDRLSRVSVWRRVSSARRPPSTAPHCRWAPPEARRQHSGHSASSPHTSHCRWAPPEVRRHHSGHSASSHRTRLVDVGDTSAESAHADHPASPSARRYDVAVACRHPYRPPTPTATPPQLTTPDPSSQWINLVQITSNDQGCAPLLSLDTNSRDVSARYCTCTVHCLRGSICSSSNSSLHQRQCLSSWRSAFSSSSVNVFTC